LKVRVGNNSVNSALIFGLQERLDPMIRLTADYRGLKIGGWSPKNPETKAWIGVEFSL
jgi:hypothetical protein